LRFWLVSSRYAHDRGARPRVRARAALAPCPPTSKQPQSFGKRQRSESGRRRLDTFPRVTILSEVLKIRRTGNGIRHALQMVRTYENWSSAFANRIRRSENPARSVIYRVREGPRFEMDRGPHGVRVINAIWGQRIYEPNEDFRPRHGWTVLDLGAHKGSFTIRAALVVDRVVAVEPAPYNILRLRRNLELNGLDNVVVIESAVGAAHGRIHMHLDAKHSGLGSIARDEENNKDVAGVPVATLEEVLERAGNTVDLMKMDIEGAETDVLAAATPQILQRIRRIILEYHQFGGADAQAVAEGIVSLLGGVGFDCKIQSELSLIHGVLRAQEKSADHSADHL
jgi:FkbM family methyltransferase